MEEEKPARRPVRLAGFNVVELVGGAALSVLGLAAAWAASGYGLGSLRMVGPGMFPMILGFVLAALGVAVIFDGRTSDTVIPRVPWRAILSISAGLIAFGLLIERAGAVVAILALVALSGLAERRYRPLALLGVAVGAIAFMAVLAWAFYGAVNIRLLPEGV